MTTLAQVRDGLKTRLDTIDGLRVYDHVPGDANFPAAIIYPPTIADYRSDLGEGAVEASFTVGLFVPVTLARQANNLYPFIERTGAQSVFATVEADRDLGFADVDAHAVSVEQLELTEIGGKSCVGVAVTVQIFAGG